MMKKELVHATRLRHARYYIKIAKQAERQYMSGGDGIARGLALFDSERANLDAARAWLQQTGSIDARERDRLLLADAEATHHIGELRYAVRDERVPQFQMALGAARRFASQNVQSVFLLQLGKAYDHLGDTRQAIACYQQALTIAREIADRRREAETLGFLGKAYCLLGEVRCAIRLHNQQLAIAHRFGCLDGQGYALWCLGVTYTLAGELRQASCCYEQSRKLAHERGAPWAEAAALSGLGRVYHDRGDIDQAISCYQRSLDILRAIGDQQGEGLVLNYLGAALLKLGKVHQALALHQQALNIARAIHHQIDELTSLSILGQVYSAMSDVSQAVSCYEHVLELNRAIGNLWQECITFSSLGMVYFASGDTDQAIVCYQQALDIACAIDNCQLEGEGLNNLGNAYVRRGNMLQALSCYQHALGLARDCGNCWMEGNILMCLGAVYSRLGEKHQAADYYLQALNIAPEICDRSWEVAQGDLGTIYIELGDTHQTAFEGAHMLKDRAKKVPSLDCLEQVYLRLGDAYQLITCYQRTRDAADDSLRSAVEAELMQQDLHGWRVPEPVYPLWASGHAIDLPTYRLDQQLYATPAPLSEQAMLLAVGLEQTGLNGTARTPDVEDITQIFLPVLGDIALAAHGDGIARTLAEAAVPLIQQQGYRIAEAARRICAGDTNEAALLEGLGDQDAALVKHVLCLVRGGPDMIVVARAVRLRELRRWADAASEQALSAREVVCRSRLDKQLEDLAVQAGQQLGAPWQELAEHLLLLAARVHKSSQAMPWPV